MENKTRIKVNSGSRSIVKLGFLLRGSFILFMAIGVMSLGISYAKESIIAVVLLIGIGLGLFYVFFKMLDAAFFSEELWIGSDEIKYRIKKITGIDEKVFLFSEIKSLGFAGYQVYTNHPMDNPIVDFTGLAAGEREMQYVIDEGTLEIVTDTNSFRFGKNLPSWEAEEVITQLQTLTDYRFERKDQAEPALDETPDEDEGTESSEN